jgi:hydroxylamine reductase
VAEVRLFFYDFSESQSISRKTIFKQGKNKPGLRVSAFKKKRTIMFCFQCQETAKNTGCTVKGVCGKPEDTANLQGLLIYALRGIAVYGEKSKELGISNKEIGLFVAQALFATITNANFDNDRIMELIKEALNCKETLKEKFLAAYQEKNGRDFDAPLHHSAVWFTNDMAEFDEKAKSVGVLATEKEDVRSLRELLIIGLKRIAAYADHAAVLGVEKDEIYDFLMEALTSTTKDLSLDEMVALVLKAGEVAVTTMATLDEANTSTYGHPEITEVNIGVGSNPAILISGHDFKKCSPPEEIETGIIVAGFAHNQVLALADKVVDAVKSGAIKRFVVMAGCDGRQKSRSYFTEVAEALPQDAVIPVTERGQRAGRKI